MYLHVYIYINASFGEEKDSATESWRGARNANLTASSYGNKKNMCIFLQRRDEYTISL